MSLGLNQTVIRRISAAKALGTPQEIDHISMIAMALPLFSWCLAFFGYLLFKGITYSHLSENIFVNTFGIVLVFSLPLIILRILTSIYNGLEQNNNQAFFEKILFPTLFIISACLINFYNNDIDSDTLFIVYGLTLLTSAILSLATMFTKNINIQKVSISEADGMKSSMIPNWFTSQANIAADWGIIMLSSFLLASKDVAVLAVCQRVLALVPFILDMIITISAPIFSRNTVLFGISASLRIYFKILAICVLTAIILGIFMWSLTPNILSFFGQSSGDAERIFKIMLIGYLSNLLVGPAGNFLIMTGHENTQKNITMASALFVISFSFCASQLIGLEGFAWAIFCGFIMQNALRVSAIIGIYQYGEK